MHRRRRRWHGENQAAFDGTQPGRTHASLSFSLFRVHLDRGWPEKCACQATTAARDRRLRLVIRLARARYHDEETRGRAKTIWAETRSIFQLSGDAAGGAR